MSAEQAISLISASKYEEPNHQQLSSFSPASVTTSLTELNSSGSLSILNSRNSSSANFHRSAHINNHQLTQTSSNVRKNFTNMPCADKKMEGALEEDILLEKIKLFNIQYYLVKAFIQTKLPLPELTPASQNEELGICLGCSTAWLNIKLHISQRTENNKIKNQISEIYNIIIIASHIQRSYSKIYSSDIFGDEDESLFDYAIEMTFLQYGIKLKHDIKRLEISPKASNNEIINSLQECEKYIIDNPGYYSFSIGGLAPEKESWGHEISGEWNEKFNYFNLFDSNHGEYYIKKENIIEALYYLFFKNNTFTTKAPLTYIDIRSVELDKENGISLLQYLESNSSENKYPPTIETKNIEENKKLIKFITNIILSDIQMDFSKLPRTEDFDFISSRIFYLDKIGKCFLDGFEQLSHLRKKAKHKKENIFYSLFKKKRLPKISSQPKKYSAANAFSNNELFEIQEAFNKWKTACDFSHKISIPILNKPTRKEDEAPWKEHRFNLYFSSGKSINFEEFNQYIKENHCIIKNALEKILPKARVASIPDCPKEGLHNTAL